MQRNLASTRALNSSVGTSSSGGIGGHGTMEEVPMMEGRGVVDMKDASVIWRGYEWWTWRR